MVAKAPDPKALRLENERKKAKAREDAFNKAEFIIHFRDEQYKFRGGLVTMQDALEFRRETGRAEFDPIMITLSVLMQEGGVPVDWAVQLLWLARRQDGIEGSLEALARSIPLGTQLIIELPDGGVEPVAANEVVFPDPTETEDSSPT